jgi:N-acetylglucosamine malate deacetylase 2
VHGISGHADHLVCHAAVKGAFVSSAERKRRLAFFTLVPTDEPERVPLRTSRAEQVGAAIEIDERDVETAKRALACYETYRFTIDRHDPLRRVGKTVVFELWRELHPIPLRDLTELL